MKNNYNLVIKGKCNTNCSFCNFYETKKNVNSYKHFLELKKEVNSAYSKGYKTIYIGFYGYEPTTFKYFENILLYIKDKGFCIYLNTNGVLFSDYSFLKKVYKFLDKVYITIYSTNNKEHFLYTQKKQSYLLKHKAILNLLSLNIKINIKILILKNTIFNLDIFINQILKYNTNTKNQIKIGFLSPEMDYLRIKVLTPTYFDIINSLNKSENLLKDIIIKKIKISTDMPICLQNFLIINKNSIKYHSTSLSAAYIYVSKCLNCKYKKNKSCIGLNKKYYEVYGDEELLTNEIKESILISDNEIYKNINSAKKLYEVKK